MIEHWTLDNQLDPAAHERAVAIREALVMLAEGRHSVRCGNVGATANYRRLAWNIMHRSVARQAEMEGIRTYGWAL